MKNKNNIELDSIKVSSDLGSDTSPKNKGSKKHWTKKTKLIVIISIISALLIGAGAFAYFKFFRKVKRNLDINTIEQVDIKPKTLPSPLTGIEVEEELANRPIYGIVIENLYPSARPQSGLSSAGVVYETLAEGGITRYLAMFGDQKPKDIGPIRSLRTYFVSWGMEYNAPVVHAGANADAIDLAKKLGMKDISAFYSDLFRRINTRFAPHNLYITGDNMDQLLVDMKYNNQPDFETWSRKDDQKSETASATDISINFSYKTYLANYKYNPENNSYLRFLGGKPDIDNNTNQQIEVKNVIVMYMPISYGRSRANEATTKMQLVGSNRAQIFLDGTLVEGTWKKDSYTARTKFYDTNNQEIKLNRGTSWVAVIPTTNTVNY